MIHLKKSFASTEYCGLCRALLPLSRLEGLDAWRSEFRANADDDRSVEITETASLDEDRRNVDVSLTGHLPVQVINVCRNPEYIELEYPCAGPAFCFHDWCYSILTWKLQYHPTKLVVYKLVQSLTPNPSVWENTHEFGHQLDPIGSLQTLIAHADSLFKSRSHLESQLLSLLRLPAEVRAQIWKYVGLNTPYSALILVAGETSRLVHHIIPRSSYDLVLKQGSYLYAQTIMIFGIEYIRDLNCDEDSEAISNIIKDVTLIKFIASINGICAVKLLGNGWESGWLGKFPCTRRVWHGILPESTSSICCSFNDLNCTNISSLCSSSALVSLWDQAGFPPSLVDPDAVLFNYSRDILGTKTLKRRFFRYLPLFDGEEYIRGLTVYLRGRGIVGLEAEFLHKSYFLGHRTGCSQYFRLSLKEQIAYAWLRVLNGNNLWFPAAALTIQTTLGRTYTFGPFIWPSYVEENSYRWILMQSKGCATAFYFENLSSTPTILSLGIISDGTSIPIVPQIPRYYACDIPVPPLGAPSVGLFASVAEFTEVKRVEMCRVSDRCIGILIHYISGFTGTLGQWHAQDISEHSCIYNSDTTSASLICFKLKKSRQHTIVTDICFLEDSSSKVLDPDYQIFKMGVCINWWFSEFYDVIMPCTGRFLNIPVESKVKQEQFSV